MNGSGVARGVLTCSGLRTSYGGRCVLDVETLGARQGETLAVLGPSGSGKSTLLRLLALLERPDAGEIRLDDRLVTTHSRHARREMPLVFQDPYLFRGTVEANVGYGLRLRRVPRDERAARVASALETVGLADRARAGARTLSGGEAQRVALARALVLDPRVLLLDEPLASLDTPLRRRLAADFGRILADAGTTAIWVTHDQDEAAIVGDRAAVMREGAIVLHGAIDDVLGLPADDWVAAFVGTAPPMTGLVVASSDGLATVDCDGVLVEALSDVPPGTPVQLGVRPEDVTLLAAAEVAPASSARNRLLLTVADVTPRGATSVVSCARRGFRLSASISRTSERELELVPGSQVVASFKATAVRVTTRVGAEVRP